MYVKVKKTYLKTKNMNGIRRLESGKQTINILDYFDQTATTDLPVKVVIDENFRFLLSSATFDLKIDKKDLAVVEIKEVFYQHTNEFHTDMLEFFLKIKEKVLDIADKQDKAEFRKRLATLAYFMKYQDWNKKGFLSFRGRNVIAPVKDLYGDILCVYAYIDKCNIWTCRASKPATLVAGHNFWSRNEF